MNRGVGFFATEHETGDLGVFANVPCDHLIHARTRANISSRSQWSTRKKVAGLRTMNVSLEGLGIVKPPDEMHVISVWDQ